MTTKDISCPTMSSIRRFLKSMPLVFHVFIDVAVMVYLVAVMVCGRHGIGPKLTETVMSEFTLADCLG